MLDHYETKQTWNRRTNFNGKLLFSKLLSNFVQARRELYWIILAYGNPPGSSYELFLTPKIYDLELQTKCAASRSTAGPEFISDMKSTYLELQDPAQNLSPDDFFRVQKSRKQAYPARKSWKVKFVRTSWNNCLRIFFCVIFDVDFWFLYPEKF